MRKPKDNHKVFDGDVFSRLTVLGFSHHDKRFRRHYSVRCECGIVKTVQGTLLRSGNTKSCGCLAKESKSRFRLPNNRGIINQIILQYKRHARDRDIAFNLSFEEVENLVGKPCFYCGNPSGNLKITKNHHGFPHNGIDRVDSTKSYYIENVVPCCGTCNKAKGRRSMKDFVEWAKRVAMAEQWG
jgi:hypothetical protein